MALRSKYLGFMTREGTLDQYIVDSIYRDNEYRLPTDRKDIDLVIDIGAHIGAFSKAAVIRGATKIIAIEADLRNFELAKQNLVAEIEQGRVELIKFAVWRSAQSHQVYLSKNYYENSNFINTGSKKISESNDGTPIATTSLDEILDSAELPDDPKILVKLDCEGAEWPILYSFEQFDKIHAICGEYHQSPGCFEKVVDNVIDSEHMPRDLKKHPSKNGFAGQFTAPCEEGLGLFWAVNQC